jgi:Secretory lipase
MGQIKLGMAALGAAVFLAACGGGGGGSYAISGLAATGAALTNANIAVKCTSGPTATGSTDSGGNFGLILSSEQALPCLVQVTKGSTTLYSFATTAGRLNVTPLTDLVVTKALNANPADAFANFDATKGTTITAGLAAAKTYVAGQLTALTLNPLVGDPLTSKFVVGDADDLVLDAFKVAMDAAGLLPEARRLSVIAGQSLTTAVTAGTARGTVVGTPAVVYTHTAAAIDTATTASGLIGLAGAAKCDVRIVPLTYNTVGVKADAATATGVLMLPSGADPACTASKTLVAYSKGTDVQKNRSFANPADSEAFMLAAMYAAQGHAVVATNYLGYAGSSYTYHPYLHADSEASSIVDVIRAGRAAATTVGGANLSGRVMVTGYSQGGHASMAAQRAIERDHSSEINLILGAHLSGPYNLAASFKSDTVVAGVQFFVPFLLTAWQQVYGNIYSNVNDVFLPAYATGIETLLPNATLTFTTLVTSGALPGMLGETPTQARDKLFQAAFLSDMRNNNNNTAYLAAQKNDVATGWTPVAQTLLCAGSVDPTVPYTVHTQPGYASLYSRAPTKVSLVDVNAYVAGTYAAVLSSAPATYYANYHGSYVPPFCAAQARARLTAVLAAL